MPVMRTEAFLLRAIRFRETSRIAVLFGRDSGKLRVIAKGYRDPKSRCAGALEPFRRIEIVYYFRPSRELQIVSQADVVRFFSGIEKDVYRYFYASAALELIGLMLPDDEPSPVVFDLIDRTLEVLDHVTGARAALVFRGFQARLCAVSGFLPELESCVVCEGEVPANRLFSAAAGGFVCGNCAGAGTEAEAIAPEAAGLFRFLLGADPGEAARSYAPEVRPAALEVARLIESFMAAHVDRYTGLRSLKALGRLVKAPGELVPRTG